MGHLRKDKPPRNIMLAQVYTCAVIGLEGEIVNVEVDTGRGLPSFTLVGLPDAAIKESAERVRAAIKNSGLTMPGGRITVNLAPADLRKAGPSYDLPIALGVLAAAEQVPVDTLQRALVVPTPVSRLPAAHRLRGRGRLDPARLRLHPRQNPSGR